MFVKPQDLVDAKRKPTLEEAQKYIDGIFSRIKNNTQGCKYDRPWNIVNLTGQLDPDQPWIGFEFETGFDDKKEYLSVVNYLWNEQDYTSIDREGTGNFPMEIVYSPMNAADVFAGKSTLMDTLHFIENSKFTVAKNPTTFTMRDVGIHANISTKKFRDLTKHDQSRYDGEGYRVTAALNELLMMESDAQREELYGRSRMYWGCANCRGKYIELKLFRSSADVKKVTGYVNVVSRIITLLDYLIDNPKKRNVVDVYGFLSGRRDTVER